MTRSTQLIAHVRRLAARCPEGAIQKAALELAAEHEIVVAQALAAEKTIHRLVKDWEREGP
jgi:predicted transposase YbfD/YdcC